MLLPFNAASFALTLAAKVTTGIPCCVANNFSRGRRTGCSAIRCQKLCGLAPKPPTNLPLIFALLGSDPSGFDMTSRGCVLDGDLRHRLSNLEALQALGLGLKLGRTLSSSPHMRNSQFGES